MLHVHVHLRGYEVNACTTIKTTLKINTQLAEKVAEVRRKIKI